ncbi:hypothetical protein [Candidatus Colwellia aromaticivorans]|nr:hypothetical protein [Candidatus Colwellia aromaticivorans]
MCAYSMQEYVANKVRNMDDNITKYLVAPVDIIALKVWDIS